MPDFPEPYIETPTKSHTQTIIFLHGRGSSGPEFASDLFESVTPAGQTLPAALPNCKWVFPSAKNIFDTLFQEQISEWFDIYSLTDPRENEHLQLAGLADAVDMLDGLIRQESELLANPRGLVLAGISQGMATAIVTLLAVRPNMGGMIGIAGWLPLRDAVERVLEFEGDAGMLAEELRTTLGMKNSEDSSVQGVQGMPIFLGHGRDDAVVSVKLGRQAKDTLERLGAVVEWKEYEGAEMNGHWLKEPEQFLDLVEIIRKLDTRGIEDE